MNQVSRLRLGKYEVQSNFGTRVTYGVNTGFEVKVLATSEDINCLGKHDQCRKGENEIEAI